MGIHFFKTRTIRFQTSIRWLLATMMMMGGGQALKSQQALLINFGSASCADQNSPELAIVKNPLTANPLVLAQCGLQSQLPNFYSVFVAYNPRDNRVYVCDIRNGDSSRIWPIDIGLPASILCPPAIAAAPTYKHAYVSNNFEFDNDGNLWSIAAYNASTGTARMDQFDVASGQILRSKLLAFPTGNAPSTIFTGDITILPNGRMFAVLGNPSRLYEIIDYQEGSNPATAIFLQSVPATCFAIAYLNGALQISGTNLVNQCYAYLYTIASNTLSSLLPFQNSLAPLDNTSITPALGAAKKIVQAVLPNASTAEITYEIFVRNLGNVQLNDINVSDDLGQAFGAANVEVLSVAFSDGGNAAGLLLDPSFNGNSHTNLLLPGQQLANQTAGNSQYFFKCILRCRVSNLQHAKVYFNSAVASATINNAIDKIVVSDSSNNGDETMVDPDRDGNAGGIGENLPTPFSIRALPVKKLVTTASRKNSDVLLHWEVSLLSEGVQQFWPEFSADGQHWLHLPAVVVTDKLQQKYEQWHLAAPAGVVYYRIQQQDVSGAISFSNVAVVPAAEKKSGVRLYPNPTSGTVIVQSDVNKPMAIFIMDVSGSVLRKLYYPQGQCQLSTIGLAAGTYLLRVQQGEEVFWQRLTVL